MKRLFLLLLLSILLTHYSFAQSKTQQPQQQKPLTFIFSIDQIQTIATALSKLPYEQSAPIIESIQIQYQKQTFQDTTKIH